ncbi:trehalose-6-phosphate synthase [Streptomyces sp. SDr-06]|uniref:alpha,alpha-trehalose-phosphate synthase (UDP-forming) n=1 Tax=Streptomyces sp. SDr-06 TaxID=2267702 RepID=UPI000DEA70DD|nr:trehalose-6-phosphate synthase [Streptomyces sp. SDr-06]RCH67778.1 trehalose-6-phosphate synthase [Streptomyces sp. SDr-06]
MTLDLAIASDRGPVAFLGAGPRLRMERRPGSVTSLLNTAARGLSRPTLWVAPSDAEADREALGPAAQTAITRRLGYRYIPVPVDERPYREYYDDVGVRMLWLALHGLWPDVAGTDAPPPGADTFTRSYQLVNRSVAEQLVRQTTPRTPVLVQDYQLATTPGFVRTARPHQPIGLFLHTPFSAPEELARLPRRVSAAVLDGMLAANLIGFQSPRWAANFLACCESWGHRVRHGGPEDDVLGVVESKRPGATGAARTTAIRCYPVRADSALLAANARSPETRAWERELVLDPGVRHIVRVDRVDPSKNILRGLEAFELLLEHSPELRGRMVMTACLTPSRERVPEYRAHAERLRHLTEHLNHRFPGCLRVHLGHDVPRCVAALKSYDVLLVNPVRDGMNLVSQEGPQLNTRHGALVLSRGAGSSDLLGHQAELVHDPRDVHLTARALRSALALPPGERRRRAAGLRAAVAGGDPVRWLAQQLQDLERLVCPPQPGAPSP